ncbi:MAG: hypothetical protein MI740_17615, partial [Halanaerobiales bacterium]|nr:hypothetical protein [Halanaerobiales bacterium]
NLNNNATQANASQQPLYTANYFNYNPVLRFDGSNDILVAGDIDLLASNGVEVYTVFMLDPTDGSSYQTILNKTKTGNGSVANSSYFLGFDNPDNDLRMKVGNATLQDNANLFIKDEATMATFNRNTSDQYTIYQDGLNIAERSSVGTLTNSNYDMVIAGRLNSTNPHFELDGWIAEIIMYDAERTATDRQKIHSYLALKYGITIDQTTATGYLASDGTTIWTADNTYKHDIAGIANDAISGFNQSISSSKNTDSADAADITMAMDNNFTLANDDLSRTSLSNRQFLLWGHNNLSVTSFVPKGSNFGVNRTWKAENTNGVGNVFMQINLSTFPSLPAGVSNYSVLVDDDGDFNNGGTLAYTLQNSSGSLYTANPVFPAGTSYFTIGYYIADDDNDGVPNTSDLDDDNDGILDMDEGVGIDTDNDGTENSLDLDSDGDGCFDVDEAYGAGTDGDGDGVYGTGTPAVDVDGKVIGATYATPIDGDLNATYDFLQDTQFTIQPVNDECAAIGATVTLTATSVGGSGSFTYQWEVSDDNGVSDPWTNIAGETNAGYSPSTASAGLNYYRVQVADDAKQACPEYSNGAGVRVHQSSTADMQYYSVSSSGIPRLPVLLTTDIAVPAKGMFIFSLCHNKPMLYDGSSWFGLNQNISTSETTDVFFGVENGISY